MNVDIDARGNHPFVAIMAFPNEKDPIFQYSIVPSFQSHDLEALDRL